MARASGELGIEQFLHQPDMASAASVSTQLIPFTPFPEVPCSDAGAPYPHATVVMLCLPAQPGYVIHRIFPDPPSRRLLRQRRDIET